MFPPTYYAQVANGLAMLGYGLAALAIARRAGSAPARHRHAWRLLGQVYVVVGLSAVAQNAGGGAALVAGPGSAVWEVYLRWSPGLNYGRCLALYALAALLIALSLRRGAPLPVAGRTVALALGGAFAAGLAAGWMEGPQGTAHLGNFAAVNSALPLVLLSALAVAVVSGAVDRLMALALAAMIAPLPVYTLWLSWAQSGTGRGGAPTFFQLQAYYLVFELVALAIVLRRWHLARRGVPVPALLPAPLFGGEGVLHPVHAERPPPPRPR